MVFGQDAIAAAADLPQWKFWIARLCGDKIVTVDEVNDRRITMTAYRWRGVLYVTKYSNVLHMPDRSDAASNEGKS